MQVLGLCGSLRDGSYNAGLLTAAADRMPAGAELVIFDRLREIPFYDPDEDGPNAHPAAVALREQVEAADALLFAIPEYNGSIPAVVKNVVDWTSRPAGNGAIKNKIAAVIGGGPGQFGGIWAHDELRKSAKIAGARVIEAGMSVPKIDGLVDDRGVLTSATWLAKLDEVIAALAAEVAVSAAA